jgi:hypothetical protein
MGEKRYVHLTDGDHYRLYLMMVVYWGPTVINGYFTFPKMGVRKMGHPLWPWAFEWEHQKQKMDFPG